MTGVDAYFDMLGRTARDRVTGLEGTVISISFDLFGCVQAIVRTPVDKDGKLTEAYWLDVNRLEIIGKKRCMEIPEFGATPREHKHGPAEKPAKP